MVNVRLMALLAVAVAGSAGAQTAERETLGALARARAIDGQLVRSLRSIQRQSRRRAPLTSAAQVDRWRANRC